RSTTTASWSLRFKSKEPNSAIVPPSGDPPPGIPTVSTTGAAASVRGTASARTRYRPGDDRTPISRPRKTALEPPSDGATKDRKAPPGAASVVPTSKPSPRRDARNIPSLPAGGGG